MVLSEYRNGRGRMTRQHFELIARVISEAGGNCELAARFAAELKRTNPRFNPDRFVRVATGEARS